MTALQRNFEAIRNTRYDLLVIGAGVQGAAIAYKAAQRGLRVLLLDKSDFCAASSSNSLKILHGGLRYLQSLDFRRMRQSIRARRELMQLAPHLVEPLPCIMPAYGHGLKGKEVMRVAMLLNDIISLDRNAGLEHSKQLPSGYVLNVEQCREAIPGLSEQGLKGASVWYDALALNTERLVMEYILQAADMGADCVNYTFAHAPQAEASGVISVQLDDLISGRAIEVQADNVINCAGVSYQTLSPDALEQPTRWARGLNIVVKKPLFKLGAVALEKQLDAQKRMLFMVPWREQYTMIGTHYLETAADVKLFPVSKSAIQAMVDEVNAIYPAAQLGFDDVSYYQAGFLPIDERYSSSKQAQLLLSKESKIIDHGVQGGMDHYFSIQGIKYTTAPQVADKILKKIGSDSRPPQQMKRVKSPEYHDDDPEIDAHLKKKYAARAICIAPYLANDRSWLDTEHRLLRAELDYFMQDEMACHLNDVVFRRSDLGTAECPPRALLETIVRIMSEYFTWTEPQQTDELNQVLLRYAPLSSPH